MKETRQETAEALQLTTQSVVFPCLPGAAMIVEGTLGIVLLVACFAVASLLLLDRPRSLLKDSIWYRLVVAYFFLTMIGLATLRLRYPMSMEMAAWIWFAISMIVLAAPGRHWLDAVRER